MKNFHIVTPPTHISVFALFKANRGDNTEEDGSEKLHDCLLVKSDRWLYDILERHCVTVDSVDLITSSAGKHGMVIPTCLGNKLPKFTKFGFIL